jgi:glutathione S-transferase
VFQRVITPLLLGKPGDETLVAQTLANELPPVLDYLDAEVGDRAFLVGDQLTIADITVASYFVNIMHGRVEIDPARWPNVIRHRDAMWRRPSFDRLIEQEKHMIATLAAGAAVPAG